MAAVFLYFSGPWKNWPRWPQMGPGGFFPTNPDLADILGDTDFDFENLYFLDFSDPKFPTQWESVLYASCMHDAWLKATYSE